MALTAAERKRRQRLRQACNGWTEITIKVPYGQEDRVRAFAKALPLPLDRPNPDQLDLIDFIDEQLAKGSDTPK